MTDLLSRARTTTPADRDRLIIENLPLVAYLARDVHARATHLSLEDLAGVGALALVQAADAFDPNLGVPFGAYARRRILGAIADDMRSMDWASRGIRSRIKETISVRETLTAALGRTPTVAEIATAMGAPEAAVAEALSDSRRTVTGLDDPTLDVVPADSILPEDSAEESERRRVLAVAVSELPPKLKLIIEAVYLGDRQVKDIAKELGVSHSAVSQQRSEAIRLMRAALAAFHGDGPDPSDDDRAPSRAQAGYLERVASALGRTVPVAGQVPALA